MSGPVQGRLQGRVQGRLQGRVLVVAGSDSGGGAGIQADLKTVQALGGYAMTALTALTAQDTHGVGRALAVPADFVAAQITMALADPGADAVKLGMLGSPEVVATVARLLAGCGLPLVLDPVMVAKGGASLMDAATRDSLPGLLARTTLLTPNLPEAAALLGAPVTDPAAAAEALRALGPRAVLLKGGHGTGQTVRDVLAGPHGILVLEAPRLPTRHTHGTGCTLASAAATGLAQGLPLEAAVRRAHAYVQAALRHAPGIGAGHGPLGHLAGLPAWDGGEDVPAREPFEKPFREPGRKPDREENTP